MTHPSGQKVVFTFSGKEVNFQMPILDTPVEYPRDWFQAEGNSGQKPPVTIKLSKDSDLLRARSWAYSVISGNSSHVYSTVEYLYHVFKKITDTITTDWVSYGVTIPKGKINPLSLLGVTTEQFDTAPVNPNPVTLPESDDLGLVMYIAGLFRIGQTDKRYQDGVAKRISPLISATVSSTFTARINTSRVSAPMLATLSELEVLLSALDMFLERFSKHAFSKCRVGTIVLRHRGFSAFCDIKFFTTLVGCKDEADAAEWFMTHDAGRELHQLFMCNEEFLETHSYLPYALGMRLSNKSPFSATANPNIHFIVHVVGSLLGNERSINAVMAKNAEIRPATINAAIIFLRSKGTTELIPKSTETAGTASDQARDDDDTIEISDAPEAVRNPLETAMMYRERNYRFNEVEREAIRVAASKIEDPREGSIGKWVKIYMLKTLPDF